MNPIIATSIVAQRRQDLLATAEDYRRVRRSARIRRAGKGSPQGSGRAHPRISFQSWLFSVTQTTAREAASSPVHTAASSSPFGQPS